ncbi:MAG: ComEA family DNA-binding protein [Planctomycetaceae bacterium]
MNRWHVANRRWYDLESMISIENGLLTPSPPSERASGEVGDATAVSGVSSDDSGGASPNAAIPQSPPCMPDSKAQAHVDRGEVGTAFGLDRGDRRFVTVVSLAALILMAVHWVRITQWTPTPLEIDRPGGDAYRFVLDANGATWVEWMQLEGIGETLARRIVADRETHGPFPDVESLQRVPGIGPKMLAGLRPHVTVGPSAAEIDRSE